MEAVSLQKPTPASASRLLLPKIRKRLLLLKFGAIGDVVMAIPAAALMHGAGYSVDWVVSEAVAPLLRLYPWIHVIPVDEASLLRGPLRQRLKHMRALWKTLRRGSAGGYDLCATLYYDRRYRLLTLPVRARCRLSLSWNDRATRLLPGRHHTDEYARILSGRPDAETPAQLAPVPAPNLPPNPRPRDSAHPRLVLVPAGARNLLRDDALRRWPIESYVALADKLLAQSFEVVLAGGPDDRWASPYFAELSKAAGARRFADLTGSLSLVETLALMESAEVVVTHDTGPLHLAGITSASIVALFGPTDPHGRLPQRVNCVAIWGGEGFACRPCYDGRDYAPCPHNGCIRQVTPDMVLVEIQKLLRDRAEERNLPPRVLVPEHTSNVRIAPPQGEEKNA